MFEVTFVTKLRYGGELITAQVTASADINTDQVVDKVSVDYIYDLDNETPVDMEELTNATYQLLLEEAEEALEQRWDADYDSFYDLEDL